MSSLEEELNEETTYPCVVGPYEFDLPKDIIDKYPESMPYIMFHSPLQAAKKRNGRWEFEHADPKLFYDTMQALINGQANTFEHGHFGVLAYLMLPFSIMRLRDLSMVQADGYGIHGSGVPVPDSADIDTSVAIPRLPFRCSCGMGHRHVLCLDHKSRCLYREI